MIFEEKEKRSGKKFIVCSKFWPDGVRFRQRYPNKTIANLVMNRIIASISLGTWRELRKELIEGPEPDHTIKTFADVYLEEYCRIRNTRPDFKEETLNVITRIVGDRKLKQFTAADALDFEKVRAGEVKPATVNRGLAVMSNMFTFARRKGFILRNPMEGFGRLPVDEKALSVMSPAEERLIVEKTLEVDPVVGAYIGILGETGLRMTEALQLKWEFLNLGRRQLTVEASKNYKSRYVPISEYAAELLGTLTRYIGNPYVFIRNSTNNRLRAPQKEFAAGKAAAGVAWPGFHSFRHYRATQWLKHGVDIRTVKEWLGHRDIQTTMRYLHFVEGHANKKFAEAERAELMEIASTGTGNKLATN